MEHSTFGMMWQVLYPCATIAVQDKEYFKNIFLSTGASCNSWIQTLDCAMMWLVFYPCTTAVAQDKEYFLDIFSILVPAGIEH
jgi:hypothetical protein